MVEIHLSCCLLMKDGAVSVFFFTGGEAAASGFVCGTRAFL